MMAIFIPNAQASVIAVGVGAFGAGSTLTTFTGLADGTEVNGLNVNGILFSYSLGNGNLAIDGGPGTTANIAPPNVVAIGNPSGILTMTFSGQASLFGFGYALLNTGAVTNATSIALFQGATPVGGLSYNSVPDPAFSGGFAGISSTIPFDRAQVTFNSVAAPSFALDNIRTATTAAVPELPTMDMIIMAVLPIFFLGFRRSVKT
jgi:hypothetical protein